MARRRGSSARMIGAAVVCASILATAVVIGGGVAGATNGDPVLLGFGNNATSGTSINTTTGIALVVATSDGSSSASGLLGQGPTGVRGESGTGTGVSGTTTDNAGAGVLGVNTAASNSGGSGVAGVANHNIGVSAVSSQGTALAVSGVAVFSRSGTATVPAGAKKVTVSSVDLSGASRILATVQQKGRPGVAAAVPNAANDAFTIYLTKRTANAALVAWFVLS
jgi:hypothetical protein